MEVREAQRLAEELMSEFGLQDWTFCWDRSVRRFGQCRYRARQVGLSKPLTELNDRAAVEDVIRHEIAHALAGHDAGHGSAWVRQCRVTGARPDRCYDGDAVAAPPAPWLVECRPCGLSIPRHRRTKKAQRHISCGQVVTWSRA